MARAQVRTSAPRAPRASDFALLARFRSAWREFQRFVDAGARSAGMTPLQYQVLLHLLGHPDRPWATVGEIAAEFRVRHHTAVELTKRCAAAGLVDRRRDPDDRRRVRIAATALGRRKLARLVAQNRRELTALWAELEPIIQRGRSRAH